MLKQTAEFCKDCYQWSDEPRIVKLCPLHAAAPELLAAAKAVITALPLYNRTEMTDRLKAVIATTEGRDRELCKSCGEYNISGKHRHGCTEGRDAG